MLDEKWTSGGLIQLLGITFPVQEEGYVEAEMPVREELKQVFGFLHGGATIALLESAASLGARMTADLENELVFGVDVHVRHRNSVQEGMIRGEAQLDHEEATRPGVRKQFWNIAAYDDNGNTVSEGAIIIKVVTKDYYASRSKR